MNETKTLAAFSANLPYEELPKDTVRMGHIGL